MTAVWKAEGKAYALLGDGERLPFPVSVHLQVTTRCNLRCQGCWYRAAPTDLALGFALELARDMAQAGSAWLAVGGGEPMLWPPLGQLASYARSLGLRIAVTTNGTLLRQDVHADRVHASCDAMHGVPWRQVWQVLRHCKSQGAAVGVNHIVTTTEDLQALERIAPLVDTVTLLLRKPPEPHKLPDDALMGFIEKYRAQVWLDPCLGRVLGAKGLLRAQQCRQGVTSMYIDVQKRAARCSNVEKRLPYGGLIAAWERLACPPDRWQPEPCILSAGEE